MLVVTKDNRVPFRMIPEGGVFTELDNVYIKIQEFSSDGNNKKNWGNAIDENGQLFIFSNDNMVTAYPNAKIIME